MCCLTIQLDSQDVFFSIPRSRPQTMSLLPDTKVLNQSGDGDHEQEKLPVCLKTTITGPQEVSVAAAMASVLSELESTFHLVKTKERH